MSRRVLRVSCSSRANPRFTHVLLAVVGSLLLWQSASAQPTITGLSESQGTIGTVIDVTGTGFGVDKPKVFLAEDGVKVAKTKLKVLQNSDTQLTVEVKKAVLGTFTVVVDPVNGSPAESTDIFTVVPPEVTAVGGAVVQPKGTSTATVEWPSSGKKSIAIGGLTAKILSIEPTGGLDPDAPPTSTLTFRIPKGIPNGTWAVQFTNPLATVSSTTGITVVGSAKGLGKENLTALLQGAPPFASNKVQVSTSADGPTSVSAVKKGVQWSVTLPFVFGSDVAPQVYDGSEATVHYLDLKSGEEFQTIEDLTVLVSAVDEGLVSGSFNGTMVAVTEGAETRVVSGTFTYDGTYDLTVTPGFTNNVLSPGEAAPPINVQVLDVAGATGPAGNFQPGDQVEVTFRLAKDDGTVWQLAEMGTARALISGPTFNYQRVITQQNNVGTVATDNQDGTYTYTFPPLPASYLAPYNDTAAFGVDDGELTGQVLLDGTYTLALWFEWEYTVAGAEYAEVGTRTLEFTIGSTPQAITPREVVTTENCNQCHTRLQAHGGMRQTNELCVLCHTSGAEDRNTGGATPGASIDFRIMIHKIHNAAHLPSVLGVTTAADGSRVYDATPQPYQLAGFSGTHDYSDIEFPAWPNLVSPMPRDSGYSALSSDEKALEDQIRRGVTNCALCHGDPDGAGALEAPAQGILAATNPTRNACGSCHDDWIFDQLYTANGQTMPPQDDDQNCALCHDPDGSNLAIQDAHLHPLLNPSIAPGVNFTLLDVSEDGAANGDGTIDPGEKVAVTFTLTDSTGAATDPEELDRHNVMISGPSDNLNLITPEMSIPPDMLTGSQPFTVNVPMRVHLEAVGAATAGADQFTTDFAPHWDPGTAGTTWSTTVWEVTATPGGASSTIASPVVAPINYIDVINGANFQRDDYIAIVDTTVEYLRIQTVEGNRLWFSSPATQAYPVGPRLNHPAAIPVVEVTLVEQTAGMDYSLDNETGLITELAPFGDSNPIVVSYTTDLVMPEEYGLALNAGPDLGEESGTWAGKSLVSGTYSLGMWGHIDRSLTLFGETQSYRDGAPGQRFEFLVGGAEQLQPWDNITSAENCYQCHVDIQFHGSNRRGFDSCLLCHGTAGSGDRPQYVAANAPATDGVTINFREMIHTIHHGAALENEEDYQVIGQSSAAYPNNFSIHTYEHVNFPAMPSGTQDCTKCHGAGSEVWFEPASREHPTEQGMAVQEWTLVCGSCHDGDVAQAHIDTQSSPITGAEACPTCHAPGQTWAANILHMVR